MTDLKANRGKIVDLDTAMNQQKSAQILKADALFIKTLKDLAPEFKNVLMGDIPLTD